IKHGRKHRDLASNESWRLLSAKAAYQNALMELNKAAAYPETIVEADLKEAKHGLREIEKLIKPFDLSFAGNDGLEDLKEWGSTDWERKGGWFCVDKPGHAILESPKRPIPADFELRIGLCLLENKGTAVINNAWWIDYPDLLKVTLVANEGASANLEIKLGKNPDTPDAAAIIVNKKRCPGHHLIAKEKKNRPLELGLTVSKGLARLTVDGKEVARVSSVASGFHRISIVATNGRSGVTGAVLCHPAV